MQLINFFASPAGRWTRGIVGAILIVVGAILGGWGWLLVAVGAVFVIVGVFDLCLIAPLFGRSMIGSKIRAAK